MLVRDDLRLVLSSRLGQTGPVAAPGRGPVH
jgi:hypothetical protein